MITRKVIAMLPSPLNWGQWVLTLDNGDLHSYKIIDPQIQNAAMVEFFEKAESRNHPLKWRRWSQHLPQEIEMEDPELGPFLRDKPFWWDLGLTEEDIKRFGTYAG